MARCGADEPTDLDGPGSDPPPFPFRSRGRRCELLAAADGAEVTALAEHCTDVSGPPRMVTGPEVGALELTVREPVDRIEVLLADVLVTRAEVLHREQVGWSMRMGTEPEATVAAAICDAEVAAGGPLAALVEALCNRTELQLAALRAAKQGAEADHGEAGDRGEHNP